MSESIIELLDVNKQYQAETAGGVKALSLAIARGKITAVVGESGSGKSTLLKLIYGLLSPDSGKILFNGKLIIGPEEKLIPGNDNMKIITQDFNLNTYAKVYDNIAAMLPNTDLEAKRGKIAHMMDILKISRLANKRIVELSGGEQQRVAIARAMVTKPEVLLMDEPFSQVDALLKHQLRDDVRRLSQELDITIILVSHDPQDGLSLGDEMFILRNGELIERGTPEHIYNHPVHLYTARLLANSQVIAAEDGKKIGLKSSKQYLAVYPEWVKSSGRWKGRIFIVVDCYFRGFYEELLLERNGVQLRALNVNNEQYKKGDQVLVTISRYLEFDQI